MTSPHPMAHLTGERFTVEAHLGSGGMGVVLLAHDHQRDMRVALKVLPEFEAEHLARFKNEFRAVADMAHPNLVGLYELFVEDARCYFTMELVDGVRFDAWTAREPLPGGVDPLTASAKRLARTRRDLPDRVDASTPLDAPRLGQPLADLDRLRAATAGLVEGVRALHESGALHCDLKPSNVLVTETGRVVILDFGLVRRRGQLVDLDADVVEGTPGYLAPEVAQGRARSEASDWYAVGAMLFAALTGRLPLASATTYAMMLRQMQEDPPRPSAFADGVPPELDDLVVALLARDPEARADGADVQRWLRGAALPASPARSAPPFVGREAELDRLEAAFGEAARGPKTVLVEGVSGVGKSALIQRFLDRLRAEGRATVFAGRCYEREEVPFKALDSVVDALAAHLLRLPAGRLVELVPREAGALAVLFPVLRAVDVIAALPAPDPSLEPGDVRAMAAEAARELLRRLSMERPLVVAIDDLQWGDADSAQLIAAMFDPASTTRLLLVASARAPADEAELLRVVRSRPSCEALRLGPLSEAESETLSRTVLGDDPKAEAIARRAEGLPFLALELARWAAERRGATPPTVDEVVAERADALEPEARALLELSALAGIPLSPACLAKAAGLDADPLPHLRVLTARSLLRAQVTRAVEPYHDRIREVVAAGIEDARRGPLHLALAEALGAERDADPETVADHFARGGDLDRALPLQLEAAAHASEALAFAQAAALLTRASGWTLPAPARLEVRRRLADALVRTGRARDAAPLYAECARATTDDRERAALEREAAEQWLKCGQIDRGIEALRGVLDEVSLRYPDSQGEALARALVRILRLRFTEPRWETRDEAQIPPADLARVDASRAAGVGLMLVDPLRGYGFLARFLLDALAVGEPRRIAAGLCLNAVTLCRGGERGYPKARRWLGRAREMAEELDDAYLRGLADACEAGICVTTGRWAEAAELGLAAPPQLRAQGAPAGWESTAAVSLARTGMMFAGDLARLRPLVERHARAAEEVGDRFAGTYATVHGWFTAAMDDDCEAGRRRIGESLARWSHLGFHAVHFWGLYGELQYDLYEGRPARGLARLDAAGPALRRSRILSMQFYRLLLLATEASLALGAGDRRRAASRARTLRRAGPAYADALGLATESGLERDRSRARAKARAAADAFEGCGMRLHAHAARASVGDDGHAEMAALGIRRPERWAQLVAPATGLNGA